MKNFQEKKSHSLVFVYAFDTSFNFSTNGKFVKISKVNSILNFVLNLSF